MAVAKIFGTMGITQFVIIGIGNSSLYPTHSWIIAIYVGMIYLQKTVASRGS